MKVYTFSEARQNFASVLENAQKEGAVRVNRRDGRAFTTQPVQQSLSPLAVKGVNLKLSRSCSRARLRRSAPCHFSAAQAWLNLGSIAGQPSQRGWYLSAQTAL